MSPQDRRAMFVRRIGAILVLPRDQKVTFAFETTGGMGFRTPVEVTVDGREERRVIVRMTQPSAWQWEMLGSGGFVTGDELPVADATVFRAIPDAGAEEIADIVEWLFACVFEAPPTYAPRTWLYGNWARLAKPIPWFVYVLAGIAAVLIGVPVFSRFVLIMLGRFPWGP